MDSVVIVGGGISGLAIAEQLGALRPLVLEQERVPGGNVRSDVEDGRVLDRGPNGWLDNQPEMNELLERLGLSDQLVAPTDAYSARWIHADGRMQPAPTGPGDLFRSALLTPGQKLRLLAEPLAPRGPTRQSIGAFMERRLGRAVVERLVGPMVAGIYGGDPYHLSLAAAFPLLAELEAVHGGLLRGLMKGGAKGRTRGTLNTLPRGSGQLTATLAEHLGDRLRCGVRVTDLVRRGDGWEVRTPDGSVRTEQVVLTCPAFAQARLLRSADPQLAALLGSIDYAPLTVVTTAWPRDAFPRPPEGFGVLAASDEDMGGVLGTVFASCVFPHQAPEDEVLLRTMVGGARHPDAAAGDDEALFHRARAALGASLGVPRAEPRMTRIYRHSRGIPQYTVGHPRRLAAIAEQEARLPGLFLAGNHLNGIGVKDCVREAKRVAHRVIRYSGA